ncbi:hypothetical protein CVIRNUC_001221 [Coccomyxa viridis]|uniref:Ribosome biogenesis protein NOP53 n=1 Tax=Coccomyxa viridis TaxID=1274662 RepID=A0AAV1HTF2_9CHLO|nr:hypothetical protein CVIRNUC_001221 [Coccomyxa viridis]
MVKAKAGVAKLRQKAERRAKEEAAKQRDRESRDPPVAHRLQKKIVKRAKFLKNIASSKRDASLTTQGGLKKRRKKDRVGKRLGDLSQLAASLGEAAQLDESRASVRAHVRPKGLGVGGARKRLRLVERESKRLQQVLSHPQFQADPISAITHHLTANLPPAPEAPKPKADPLMRKQQKARRKWEKKLHAGPEQMAEDSA